jgi:phospholipid/cholesterol/gamma-HCH transport system substrate-binding protein
MRFLREADPRFHLLEARTSSFLWLALVGLLGVTGFVLWKQEIFRASRTVVLVAESSQGVSVGMAARLNGFRIGKVKDVRLESENQVRVEVEIFEEYARFLRADSVASLSTEGLIGDRYIDMNTGTPRQREVEEGDVLQLLPEQSMGALMEKLSDEVRPALADARDILAYLNDPESDLRQLLGHLARVGGVIEDELPPTLGQARGTVENLDRLMARVEAAVVPLEAGLEEFVGLLREVGDSLPALVERVEATLLAFEGAAGEAGGAAGEAGALATDLREVVAESAGEVPRLLRAGARTAGKADEVMDSVRATWPIRRGIPERVERSLRLSDDD